MTFSERQKRRQVQVFRRKAGLTPLGLLIKAALRRIWQLEQRHFYEVRIYQFMNQLVSQGAVKRFTVRIGLEDSGSYTDVIYTTSNGDSKVRFWMSYGNSTDRR